ncbi:uncharacterized protein [Nicotiana sylvestris]|uniref:uncharacterized protein n=1 Tax=Nicotiana sylvestris TaxID=4096 RepID=UPI00388C968B
MDIIDCIPKIVTEEDNGYLTMMPTEQEIKEAILNISSDSVAGPDGFLQWRTLLDFSHTCLVLIPKIDAPETFSDLRPISLSNVSSKIISKILSRRLNPLLTKLISNNQSGFVKDRLIAKNILLAQEIIQGIKNYNKGGNIVMKLDMKKAYDRMSWEFINAVMGTFSFSEKWINMTQRILSNVWYSILLNGIRNGFFTSSQGLKQGDPLSPSVFILGSEVLTRILNKLHENENFTPFTMPTKGPKINHLAYVDDIIIFSTGNNKTIRFSRLFYYSVTGIACLVLDHLWVSSLLKLLLVVCGLLVTLLLVVVVVWLPAVDTFLLLLLIVQTSRLSVLATPTPGKLFFMGETLLDKISFGRLTQAAAVSGGTIGQVKDHLQKWNEEWNTNKLEQLLPIHIVQHINTIPRRKQTNNDQAIWNLTENGHYSNASTWHIVRIINQKNLLLSKASRCNYCSNPQSESLYHVFIDSEAARNLWELFGNPLGVRHQTTSNSSVLTQWWQRKPKNIIHEMILHIIPITISWELWRNYTSCKFGESKKFVLYKRMSQIIWNINSAINKKYPTIKTHYHWHKNYEIIKHLKPVPIWKSVVWEMPPRGYLKLNTDGSFNKQIGKAGIGGILRDEEGGFVMAFSMPIIYNNISEAELKAIKYGCEWCKYKGISNFIVETDSRMIYDILHTKNLSNNKLKQETEKLMEILDTCRTPVTHCLREANQVADWFAKEATRANEVRGNRLICIFAHRLFLSLGKKVAPR